MAAGSPRSPGPMLSNSEVRPGTLPPWGGHIEPEGGAHPRRAAAWAAKDIDVDNAR